MGFEPLPFDPRSACFCHQNCPSFEQPTSRWWTVWSNPPPTIPELGAGVLVEFDLFLVVPQTCRFAAVVLPPGVFSYAYEMQPRPPIPGPLIQRTVSAITNLGPGIARNVLSNEECNISLNIPAFPLFPQFGGCNIFPVRWYENANDVPH